MATVTHFFRFFLGLFSPETSRLEIIKLQIFFSDCYPINKKACPINHSINLFNKSTRKMGQAFGLLSSHQQLKTFTNCRQLFNILNHPLTSCLCSAERSHRKFMDILQFVGRWVGTWHWFIEEHIPWCNIYSKNSRLVDNDSTPSEKRKSLIIYCFKHLIGISDDNVKSLFDIFDTDVNGLVDALELLIAIALISGAIWHCCCIYTDLFVDDRNGHNR